VYHVELRQFPHVHRQFNLSEQELRALVMPWVYGQEVEVGERKWSIHRAKLVILEGPHLEIPELAMGRGWRAAQRQSQDVSERITVAARQEIESSVPPPAAQGVSIAGAAGASVAGAAAGGGVLSDPLAPHAPTRGLAHCRLGLSRAQSQPEPRARRKPARAAGRKSRLNRR
jgi:hypothetical protein